MSRSIAVSGTSLAQLGQMKKRQLGRSFPFKTGLLSPLSCVLCTALWWVCTTGTKRTEQDSITNFVQCKEKEKGRCSPALSSIVTYSNSATSPLGDSPTCERDSCQQSFVIPLPLHSRETITYLEMSCGTALLLGLSCVVTKHSWLLRSMNHPSAQAQFRSWLFPATSEWGAHAL